MKLFTLDNRLILKKIGTLADADRASPKKHLGKLLSLQESNINVCSLVAVTQLEIR